MKLNKIIEKSNVIECEYCNLLYCNIINEKIISLFLLSDEFIHIESHQLTFCYNVNEFGNSDNFIDFEYEDYR